MPKIVFLHGCYLALRSRSKVGVKVKGRGQGQMSGQGQFSGVQQSMIGARLCRVQQRAMSHYQFKVFVCVSVISGRVRIITRMLSIGVLIRSRSRSTQLIELDLDPTL